MTLTVGPRAALLVPGRRAVMTRSVIAISGRRGRTVVALAVIAVSGWRRAIVSLSISTRLRRSAVILVVLAVKPGKT